MAAANSASAPFHRAEISRLKEQLGIQRLALQVHSASFPERIEAGGRGEDFGRGSPYSYGAERLYEWAAELGFDTIQLGPLGMTSPREPFALRCDDLFAQSARLAAGPNGRRGSAECRDV
jgi:hypothetical protein